MKIIPGNAHGVNLFYDIEYEYADNKLSLQHSRSALMAKKLLKRMVKVEMDDASRDDSAKIDT